ncbi:hypothetical protein LEP1GSC040_0313 [Leptospira santarosai str. 2000030832]|nr:hypothetical protein LEP1GSC040_0313 [Leptospira santarosai str. 2000030832]
MTFAGKVISKVKSALLRIRIVTFIYFKNATTKLGNFWKNSISILSFKKKNSLNFRNLK